MAKRVDVERVQQLLEPLRIVKPALRTEASASKNGYWVVIPAHASSEEAKRRAEERLKEHLPGVDVTRAEAALQRSLTRLKIAEKRRKRRPGT